MFSGIGTHPLRVYHVHGDDSSFCKGSFGGIDTNLWNLTRDEIVVCNLRETTAIFLKYGHYFL